MCTVAFLPTARGFRLAMNRDEKRAIYPRERSGGTWLAANDAGLWLALINWHTIARGPNEKPESRGRIIPSLAGAAEVRAIVELRWDLEELSARHHPWRTQ